MCGSGSWRRQTAPSCGPRTFLPPGHLTPPGDLTPRTKDLTLPDIRPYRGFDPAGHTPYQGFDPTGHSLLPDTKPSSQAFNPPGHLRQFYWLTPWSWGLFEPAVFVFDNSLPQLVLTSLTFSSPRVFDPLIFWPPCRFDPVMTPQIFLTHYSSPMPSHPQFHQFYWSAVSTHLR